MSIHVESNQASSPAQLANEGDPIMHVICSIQEAHAYQLPPKQTPGNFKAEEWSKVIWTGVVQVRSRLGSTGGDIVLSDEEGTKRGRVSMAQIAQLEKVVDSSRYFVVPIESEDLAVNCPEGRIGLGFKSRNDAFAFNSALQDLQSEGTTPVLEVTSSIGDLRLQEGETLRIDVKRSKDRPRARPVESDKGSSKKQTQLAPPPPPGKTRQRNRRGRAA